MSVEQLLWYPALLSLHTKGTLEMVQHYADMAEKLLLWFLRYLEKLQVVKRWDFLLSKAIWEVYLRDAGPVR
jgi:hypothetical protein